MGLLGNIATEVAAPVVGGIMGMIAGKSQDRRQINQQKKLQEVQVKGAKELKDYDNLKQKEMWDATNYEAQMEHIKNAGLNPALMYGMSGGGGTTAGGSGMPMPTTATAEGSSAGVRNIMEMAMMKAQTRLLESQANKNEVEAEKTAGVDTQEVQTRILDLTQGIQNKQAQEALTKAQTIMQGLQNEITNGTAGIQMQQIEWTAQQALNKLQQAENETYISNETRDNIVTQIQTATIGMLIENEAKKQGIKTQQAQVQKMAQDIAQGWKGLEQKDTGLAIDKFKANTTANYPSIMNTIGRVADDTIEKIFKLGGKYRPTTKNVE